MRRIVSGLVSVVAIALVAAASPGGAGTALAQEVCPGDTDCDGMPDAYELGHECLDAITADGGGDPDGDFLSSLSEHDFLTDPCEADTDDDGCTDAEELGPDPVAGGDRDPLYYWDFYDVAPVPAPGPGNDRSVDLKDTLLILGHFGHSPEQDSLDNALDRDAGAQPKRWRSQEASGTNGVDLTDALANLIQFGHVCFAPL